MSEWSRAHDKLMAERCEGLTVEKWSDVMARGEAVNWMTHPDDYCFYDPQHKCPRAVYYYNTDIAACFRAAIAYANACGRCDFVINLGKPIGLVAPMEWLDCRIVFGDAMRHLDKCKSVEDLCAEVAQALYEAVKDA